MNTPTLIRVKILKFMLSRIDEPLTLTDIVEGSNSTGKKVFSELTDMLELKMITSKINGFKLSFTNAQFIAKNFTELAIVCNFSEIIKKKMKEYENQV